MPLFRSAYPANYYKITRDMNHAFYSRSLLDIYSKLGFFLFCSVAICRDAFAQEGNILSGDDAVSNETTPTASTPVLAQAQ